LTEEALENLPKESYNYLAMIDAGSSGCRAHVFRYGMLGSSTGKLYILPKHVSKKVRPGLSTFAENPTAAGASLADLVAFMKTEVPESEWSQTPIWLKATAGLRMLETSKSTAILNSVRGFLSDPVNSPFYFENGMARIISGQEEGAFGWISVNYLKKIIGPFAGADQAATIDTAYAVVEMGGASTQVTQIIPHGHRINHQYMYAFSIQGSNYELYTHSYLGYGSDQARIALNQHLVETSLAPAAAASDASSPKTLVDPCLNPGYFRESKSKEGLGNVYVGPTGSFHVVGGGDDRAHACHEILEGILFPLKHGIKHEKCQSLVDHPVDHISFNCIYQPAFVRQSKNFLVFENFFYAASGMGTLPAGHDPLETADADRESDFPLQTSPREYRHSAEEACGLSWDKIQMNFPRDATSKEQNTRWCFSASYAYLFLTHGIGLKYDQVITVQQSIENSDIEWALGAAYKEAAGTLGRSFLRGSPSAA
jgi:Golgi nucleoside diphosphatase